MIKRIVLGLIGVVAGAVAISAATHAVDFEDSTIEDGDTRYAIAAIGATIFVLCVFAIVRSLSSRRRARRLVADATKSLTSDVGGAARSGSSMVTVPSRSLADRLPARPTEAARPGAGTATSGVGPGPGATGSRGTASVFAERWTTPDPTTETPAATDARRATLFPNLSDAPSPDTTPETAPSVGPPPVEPPPAVTASPDPSTDEAAKPSPAEAAGTDAPLVLRDYSPSDIDATIDKSGREAVEQLVAAGALTSEGPLTPDDIRTMLFIALSTQQMRGILHDARAQEPLFALGGGPSDPEELPTWVDVDETPDPGDAPDPDETPDPGDDEPPSGRLYAAGA